MLAFDPPFSYIDSRLFTCTLSIGGAKIHHLQLRSQSDFAHRYHTGLKDRMIDSGRVKDLPGTEEGCSIADSPDSAYHEDVCESALRLLGFPNEAKSVHSNRG